MKVNSIHKVILFLLYILWKFFYSKSKSKVFKFFPSWIKWLDFKGYGRYKKTPMNTWKYSVSSITFLIIYCNSIQTNRKFYLSFSEIIFRVFDSFAYTCFFLLFLFSNIFSSNSLGSSVYLHLFLNKLFFQKFSLSWSNLSFRLLLYFMFWALFLLINFSFNHILNPFLKPFLHRLLFFLITWLIKICFFSFWFVLCKINSQCRSATT